MFTIFFQISVQGPNEPSSWPFSFNSYNNLRLHFPNCFDNSYQLNLHLPQILSPFSISTITDLVQLLIILNYCNDSSLSSPSNSLNCCQLSFWSPTPINLYTCFKNVDASYCLRIMYMPYACIQKLWTMTLLLISRFTFQDTPQPIHTQITHA